MKRRAFPASPLPVELPAAAADPWLTLAAFALLTLTVGLAWAPAEGLNIGVHQTEEKEKNSTGAVTSKATAQVITLGWQF